MNRLWTWDFTIITVGSIVSMLGNSITGFAISLLVLDNTGSTFLYSLLLVLYNLPKLVMPMLIGPYLDAFSRKKVIYMLDFICAGIFLVVYFVLRSGSGGYAFFTFIAIIMGGINSVYQVAYDSFYPILITEGNYRKAYAISSAMYPLSAAMIPVATWIYENFGLTPLFLINTIAFFVAAVFETQIKTPETHVRSLSSRFNLRQYTEDFKEGVRYIKGERGLLIITLYFGFNCLTGTGAESLMLPYFQKTPELGVSIYPLVTTSALVARLIACAIHYRHKIPAQKKFSLAISSYAIYTCIVGGTLFLPVPLMMLANFCMGFVGITSYNIRISATQNYVPDSHRGRFNGVFQMVSNLGSVLSQLLAGLLTLAMDERSVILLLMLVNLLFIYLIMYRGREYVKPIYNQDL